MAARTIAVFLLVLFFVDFTVSRHMRHRYSKYKRDVAQKRQLANRACCAAAQAPFNCCEQQQQSAPVPSCCQQQQQQQQQQPITITQVAQPQAQQQACCSSVQAPSSCCQAESPPSCCQQSTQIASAQSQAPQACCASSQAQPSVLELSPATPDYSCCQSSNPPPCCIGLGLKPGQSKNITLNGGDKQFLLQVKLIPLPPGQAKPVGTNQQNANNPCGAQAAPPCRPGPLCHNVPTNCLTTTPSTNGTVSPTSVGPTGATTKPTGSPASPPSPPPTGVTPTTGAGGGAGPQDLATCRQESIKATNEYRNKYGSPPLVKDDALNKEAQDWATAIANDKNPRHSTRNTRPGEGENVAKRCQMQDVPFDERCKLDIDLWYGENKNYDYNNPGKATNAKHFTQLVWKGTTKMGIGRASYQDASGAKCLVLVARYSPVGNIEGQYPQNVQQPKPNADQPATGKHPLYLE